MTQFSGRNKSAVCFHATEQSWALVVVLFGFVNWLRGDVTTSSSVMSIVERVVGNRRHGPVSLRSISLICMKSVNLSRRLFATFVSQSEVVDRRARPVSTCHCHLPFRCASRFVVVFIVIFFMLFFFLFFFVFRFRFWFLALQWSIGWDCVLRHFFNDANPRRGPTLAFGSLRHKDESGLKERKYC